MKVPKIPKEQQLLSISHGEYPKLQHSPYAHARMVAGTERYGHSWCETNLKEDLLEEAADIRNYVILMKLRYDSLDVDMPLQVQQTLTDILYDVSDIEYIVCRDLPEFDGPTSAEWVANQ